MRTIEKHSLMLSGIYTHNASCQTIQRAFILIIYFLIFLLIEWTRAAWDFFLSHIKGQFKSCSQWRMFSMNTKSLYGPTESESTQEIGEGAKIVTLRLFKVYMAWIPFFCFFAPVGWKRILRNLLRGRILFQQWREMQLKWKFEEDFRFNSKEPETRASLGIGKTY